MVEFLRFCSYRMNSYPFILGFLVLFSFLIRHIVHPPSCYSAPPGKIARFVFRRYFIIIDIGWRFATSGFVPLDL